MQERAQWHGTNLPISVLRRILALASSSNVDVGKDNVARVCHKVVPLWRVSQVQVLDTAPLEPNCSEENRAEDVDILRIEIIPHLAVAIECTTAVDIDIGAAELEERGCVLEGLVEGIGLPVVGVVAELDGSLNVCSMN